MLEFVTASEQHMLDGDAEERGEEAVIVFTVAGEEFAARRPTPGETNILFSARRGEGTRVVWQIFDRILVDPKEPEDGWGPQGAPLPAFNRLRDLVFTGKVPVSLLFGGDELNSRGILDSIIAEFAGRPTEESTTSSDSPPPAGKRSTGRSPGRGSTRSTSA